jgi:hypothetical protein
MCISSPLLSQGQPSSESLALDLRSRKGGVRIEERRILKERSSGEISPFSDAIAAQDLQRREEFENCAKRVVALKRRDCCPETQLGNVYPVPYGRPARDAGSSPPFMGGKAYPGPCSMRYRILTSSLVSWKRGPPLRLRKGFSKLLGFYLGEVWAGVEGEGDVGNVRDRSGVCGGTLPHVERKLIVF